MNCKICGKRVMGTSKTYNIDYRKAMMRIHYGNEHSEETGVIST